MLNSKAIEINNFTFLQNKAIQCVPVSVCSSRFITHALSSFLGKLSLEKTPLNLGSFSKYFVFQSLLKDEAALKVQLFS